jgi:hypothetical protein
MAEVQWLSDKHAEVNVRFTAEAVQRSATRSLEFRDNDESAERYRTLGFAVGSMAGAVTETTPKTEPLPEPEPDPIPSPLESTQEYDDPPAALPAAPSSEPPLPEFEDDYRFGLQVASGIESTRWGVGVGARGSWSRRWLLDAAVSYSTQSSNSALVEAAFVNVALGAGAEFAIEPIVGTVAVGPVLQWQQAERLLVEGSASDGELRLGGEIAFGLRYRAPVAPFAEARGSWFDPTDVRLPEDKTVNFGQIQFQVVLGLVLSGSEFR